jgi:uncharacterized protein (DUF983 family)
MALSYAARKRWSLVVLLVGLPIYVVVAVNVIDLFDRPSLWVEVLVYVGLGVVWALPLKSLFKGIAQVDPNENQAKGRDPSA